MLDLKQKLFGVKMREGLGLDGHINVFNQLISDLVKIEVTIEEDDMAIILVFIVVVITLTYGKEDINFVYVVVAFLAHDQRKKNNITGESLGDALHVKGDHGLDKKKARRKGGYCVKIL